MDNQSTCFWRFSLLFGYFSAIFWLFFWLFFGYFSIFDGNSVSAKAVDYKVGISDVTAIFVTENTGPGQTGKLAVSAGVRW